VFAETENLFPWMSEAMDLKKKKNFFETRVIEYQTGLSRVGLVRYVAAERRAFASGRKRIRS
jgi:hypothetical protein